MSLKKYLTVIFLLISVSLIFSSYPLYKTDIKIGTVFQSLNEIPASKAEYETWGYILNLEEIDKEMCYLAIGAVRNFDITQKLFKEIGALLKSQKIDFVIFGNLQLISKDTKNKTNSISSSPYLIAEVTYRMLRGLETGGVFPIVQSSILDDKDTLNSLTQKAGKYFTYSINKDNLNSELFFSTKDLKVILRNDLELKLPWSVEEKRLKEMVMEIYKNSIVLDGYRREKTELIYRIIPDNDYTKDNRRVFYFSESVKDLAKDILDGKKPPTGRINWK